MNEYEIEVSIECGGYSLEVIEIVEAYSHHCFADNAHNYQTGISGRVISDHQIGDPEDKYHHEECGIQPEVIEIIGVDTVHESEIKSRH